MWLPLDFGPIFFSQKNETAAKQKVIVCIQTDKTAHKNTKVLGPFSQGDQGGHGAPVYSSTALEKMADSLNYEK